MSTSDLELTWDGEDAAAWDRLLAASGCSSLEQCWAYGAALAAVEGCRVRRAVVRRDGAAVAMFQSFEKSRFLPLTVARILRGPLWTDPELTPRGRRQVLCHIGSRFRLARRQLLIWSPELPDVPESHAALQACGLRRMATGYSTALLDLSRPPEDLRCSLHGKWRNALVAAERSGLGVRVASGGRTFDWLVGEAETQRRRRGYAGPSGPLIRALAKALPDQEDLLVLTAAEGRQRVAGVLLVRHGSTATYLLSWSGGRGRELRAHNLLLWNAVCILRHRGVAWLDLGGLNAVSAPGVARFKLGMGGQLFTLAGTYI